MDNSTRNMLNSYLNDIKLRYRKELNRLSQLTGYGSKRLKVRSSENGNDYYYLYSSETNKYNYIGKSTNTEVLKIKEAHYLQRSTCQLEHEINLIEKLLSQCIGSSYEDINESMQKAYKGALINQGPAPSIQLASWKNTMEKRKAEFPPFRPHELIHRTRDGTMVRSKSEALIYNYFLDLGIIFIYELPLEIKYGYKSSLLLPDFTIHSEIDLQRVIYLEHQGMMTDMQYRNKFNETIYKYWLNNYIPERDVFFTFDLPNGGFDDTPVKSIIRRHIKSAF